MFGKFMRLTPQSTKSPYELDGLQNITGFFVVVLELQHKAKDWSTDDQLMCYVLASALQV